MLKTAGLNGFIMPLLTRFVKNAVESVDYFSYNSPFFGKILRISIFFVTLFKLKGL